ncbi:MAG: response regulator [Myxococcaceae bacterium]|jgi:two-component system chemotaxis response regulator CheY|nr:response regulator [Myxococcaceae bacterium]
MSHIIIVDDAATMRDLVSMALENAGHRVEAFPDAQSALTRLTKGAPDLVITDVNMPGMNGIEFIRAARGSGHRMPILVLTTEAGPVLRQQAREAGASGWVVKPIDGATLCSTVKRVLP